MLTGIVSAERWKKPRMSEHGLSSEQLREIAKHVFIENPAYLKLGEDGAPSDINGRTMDLEMLCRLPGRDGALWRQLRTWVAVNAPGLFDRSPSPDNNLRRAREVKQEMRAQHQVQPALHQTI